MRLRSVTEDPTLFFQIAVDTPLNVEPPRKVFVLPRHRIVWVQIAKCGLTSTLRMLAQVNGGRTCTAEASGYAEWSPEGAIHDPKVHGLSRIEDLGPKERKAALTDPGWWRFAVVRSPHARFLSAWVDKVFLRGPGTPHLWDNSPDVLTSDGRIDVSATFQRFVAGFECEPARYLRDQHFAPQYTLLARDLFPDLEVIPLSEFSRVHQRLEELGHHPAPAPRFNESLHFDPSKIYDRQTHAIITEIYGADLEFDPAGTLREPADGEPLVLSKLETECVQQLRSASLRIRQLSRLAVLPRLTVWLQRKLGLR